MIEFACPAFLLLALAAPLLLWLQLRGRRTALRHPAGRLLAGLPSGRARLARWGGAVLRTLAFVLLAVALAGPRTPDLHTRIDAEGVAVMMLVDVSGSMATHDFDWQGAPISRLDAVKRVFRLFVAGAARRHARRRRRPPSRAGPPTRSAWRSSPPGRKRPAR